MAKNMSELVAEIKAIMAAKEALVTAGLMTEAEYEEERKVQFARIDRFAETAERVVVKPATRVARELPPSATSVDELHSYLIKFLGRTLEKQWGTWSRHRRYLKDSPIPERVWGTDFMHEMYCETMLGHYLPTTVEPDIETDRKLHNRYVTVVRPRFEAKCQHYENVIKQNVDNPIVTYGFTHVLSSKLTELQKEIASTKKPTRTQETEEFALTKLITSLRVWRNTVKRYFMYNNVFLAYLELMDIDITDMYPDDFVRYQGYLDDVHERVTGEVYKPGQWNEFRTRTSTFYDFLSAQKELKSAHIQKGLIASVPILKIYRAEQRHPPSAYMLRINEDGEMSPRSGVLKLYKCVSEIKNPSLKKNLDLLKICIRFMRETGLRASQFALMKWGRLPHKGSKPVRGLDVTGIFSVDFIGFQEELPGDLKQVAREYMYISKKLADMIIKYRKDYPDRTKDDYYVFSGKTFFNWSPEVGTYRTSMLASKTWKTNKLTGKRELVMTTTPAYSTIFRTLNTVCPKKYGIRILPTSFRDSYMTLMLEALSAKGTGFKDMTGDYETTARKHYRDEVGKITIPKRWHQSLRYEEVVHKIFNKEKFP